MKASIIARFASLFLVVTLLVPSFDAAAAPNPSRSKHYKGGVHRPVYKTYKGGRPTGFQALLKQLRTK
ncbi:hypothetical protein [Hymenobacter koreensis]|uniref:Uncharacterized protein n=1 Tax=Hymenobacter koreensis TaxID=1084523 RepID=A0ABP8JA81_9BACT